MTLVIALFCRAVFETVIRPSFKIKFTWRKHPRLFWAVLLCFAISFSFAPVLRLGSRDTSVFYDWTHGELSQPVTLASTNPTAPSPADRPLMSLPVKVASSDTAGCCSPVWRVSVSHTQREEMSSSVSSFSAAAPEEAYFSMIVWGLQEPASPHTAHQNALQARHNTASHISSETKLLRTISSAVATTHLASLGAPATQLVWSFVMPDSSVLATIFSLPGYSHAVQPAGRLVPLLGDDTASPPVTVFMIITTSQTTNDNDTFKSLQWMAPCPHSLPDVRRIGSAFTDPALGALEHSALLPARGRLPPHLHSGDNAFLLFLSQPMAAIHFTGESSLYIC